MPNWTSGLHRGPRHPDLLVLQADPVPDRPHVVGRAGNVRRVGESIPRLSRSGEKWSPTSKGKAKYTLSFSGVPTLATCGW